MRPGLGAFANLGQLYFDQRNRIKYNEMQKSSERGGEARRKKAGRESVKNFHGKR